MSDLHNTFASEKYLYEKMEAEVKAFRRQRAGQSIKTLIACTFLFSFFAVAAYALFMNPSFVPDSLDYMRANGILSY